MTAVALDSWAVMTLLQRGPGGPVVQEELERRPWMSWITVGEVLCLLVRRLGAERADDAELWTGDPELLVPDAPWRALDLRL